MQVKKSTNTLKKCKRVSSHGPSPTGAICLSTFAKRNNKHCASATPS
ncbi:hypothetical protein FGIG_07498 [Fasciola gigantica]|uniref:Uncharacterized protein n=1 Tax=Fasciola gigantica TaxID=46835 RepID=A0A504YNT8_FASGI|nr:hypothetical protein FGIG_07498 [Fasciola gigantica]